MKIFLEEYISEKTSHTKSFFHYIETISVSSDSISFKVDRVLVLKN